MNAIQTHRYHINVFNLRATAKSAQRKKCRPNSNDHAYYWQAEREHRTEKRIDHELNKMILALIPIENRCAVTV